MIFQQATYCSGRAVVQCKCDSCGHEFSIAFECKDQAVYCTKCNGRVTA